VSKLVRSAFVIGLREMFKTDSKYLYVENAEGMTNTEESLIEIADTTPYEIMKFPAIIIKSMRDRDNTFFFGDDLIYERTDQATGDIKTVRGSPLRLTIMPEVRAYSSIERDELSDKVYIYLRTIREKLGKLGIEVRHVTMETPSEEEFGARVQFIGGVSADTYSEWDFTDTTPANELLSGFKIALTSVTVETENEP
jgi:hypothetical protein